MVDSVSLSMVNARDFNSCSLLPTVAVCEILADVSVHITRASFVCRLSVEVAVPSFSLDKSARHAAVDWPVVQDGKDEGRIYSFSLETPDP